MQRQNVEQEPQAGFLLKLVTTWRWPPQKLLQELQVKLLLKFINVKIVPFAEQVVQHLYARDYINVDILLTIKVFEIVGKLAGSRLFTIRTNLENFGDVGVLLLNLHICRKLTLAKSILE
eukprot:TRINITY_DN41_c1_g1_i1.p4 TRINITY_DN41_c1_g1~~TRINITY_DN41_c1_g1_i1.p4  ORF type:complete len:120 (-),score=4.21 TRINITY_DN41_c1_g1_i1:63-422(-)